MQAIKDHDTKGFLSVEHFDKAENVVLGYCQKRRYSNEMSSLQKGEKEKKSSDLYKLNPKIEDGVLRVGGRLSRAAMPEEARIYII